MVCSTISTPEFELLAVRARPRYLPSEISNKTIINVYTRPSSHFSTEDQQLISTITKLQKENPRSYFIIIGDINREHIDVIETMSFKKSRKLLHLPTVKFYIRCSVFKRGLLLCKETASDIRLRSL